MSFLTKRKLTAREIEGELGDEIEIEIEREIGGAARRRSLGASASSARSEARSFRDH